MPQNLEPLAVELGRRLAAKGWMLATAESCTGGWIAKLVTDVAGSSRWFDRGFVTYSNASKQDMLGVSAHTLAANGAVSEAVVREMALGALQRSAARISVAVSGIAGPGGESPGKPVGTVWLAWAHVDSDRVLTEVMHFDGDRDAVRRQSVGAAMQRLIALLSDVG